MSPTGASGPRRPRVEHPRRTAPPNAGTVDRVEQVGRVGQRTVDPGRLAVGAVALGDDQVQVELRHPGSKSSAATVSPGSSRRGRRRFWNESTTWNSGCRAVDRAGFEHLDEPLERHVGVRERREVGLPDRASRSANVAPGRPRSGTPGC